MKPLLPVRHENRDFFVCEIFDALPCFKDDMASMEHPVFSLSTKPDTRVLHYEYNGNTITIKPTRLPTSFLALYSICYVEFSITLSLYFINQHITGYHRIDVEAIPCAPEQIKTLKTSKPFRNTCTSVDS
jgi:hypothetical protein